MPDMSTEGKLRQYEWISNRQRDAERHISELLTALLLSNSFLVAGFAFIVAEIDSKVAAYAIAALGMALCFLIFFVNLRYKTIAKKRGGEADRFYERLESDRVILRGLHMSTPGWKWLGWLSSSSVAFFWAPVLFLILWIMLIIFAAASPFTASAARVIQFWPLCSFSSCFLT